MFFQARSDYLLNGHLWVKHHFKRLYQKETDEILVVERDLGIYTTYRFCTNDS